MGDVIVGSGITGSPDGDIFATGVTTSTTFVGALTGNVTGNISGGTVAGSTGTFSSDVSVGGELQIADYILHTGDGDTALRFPALNTFTVETAGSERIRIDSDGRVMIGQTSSVVPFMVTATASNFGGMVMTGVLGDATSYASGVGGGLTLSGKYNSGGSQVGFAAIRGLKENGTDGNYDGALTLNTRPNGGNMTERARITSAGKMGVGTNDPNRTLSVKSNGGQFSIIDDDDSKGQFYCNSGTVSVWATGGSSIAGALDFATTPSGGSTTSRLQIGSAGDVTVNTGNLVIGTAGKGIDFSATANASQGSASNHNELLDDYEEGTWNPAVDKSQASMSGVTYGNKSGTYTKIGRQVTVWFDVTVNSGGTSGSGAPYITELPFAVVTGDASNGGYGAPQMRDMTLTHGNMRIYGNSSYFANSQIYLQQFNSSGGTENSSFNGSGRITGQGTYFTTT